jgi:hypothetical protein
MDALRQMRRKCNEQRRLEPRIAGERTRQRVWRATFNARFDRRSGAPRVGDIGQCAAYPARAPTWPRGVLRRAGAARSGRRSSVAQHAARSRCSALQSSSFMDRMVDCVCVCIVDRHVTQRICARDRRHYFDNGFGGENIMRIVVDLANVEAIGVTGLIDGGCVLTLQTAQVSDKCRFVCGARR